jgi:putative transposase
MARPLRVEFPGAEYHITARGNERRKIFRDDHDHRRFLECLEEMVAQFSVEVRVFCLMPNHYHLVAATPAANLSRAVGWLQTTYTIRFNRRHRRCGHLFQGRFKAQLVEADAYALALLRYIHLNPVRVRALRSAGAAEKSRRVDGYAWSSHGFYAGLKTPPPWLRLDWLRYYGTTGASASADYRKDLRQTLASPEETTTPWAKLRGGLVLGGETLWKRAKTLLAQKGGQEEIRWKRFQDNFDRRDEWQPRIAAEPDDRWKVWLRVRALGERKAEIARDLGYRDGGSVLQIIKRLDKSAQTDPALQRKKLAYEALLSSVES